VHRLGLKSRDDWGDYCSSGKKPSDIPSYPQGAYVKDGWSGWADWLGTGKFRGTGWQPFKKARAFVRRLGLQSQGDWRAYCRSGKKPKDIPSSPDNVYAKMGWTGFGDWLGTGGPSRAAISIIQESARIRAPPRVAISRRLARSVWVRLTKDTLQICWSIAGADDASETQKLMCRRVAVLETELVYLEEQFAAAREAGGEPDAAKVDLYGRLANRQRRLAECLGWQRTPRDIGPSLGDLLRRDFVQQQQQQDELS
jgi:hypothetical protein